MRNFDRSGFKSSSFSQNRRRNDDNDRYHSDDKYRNSSANKVRANLLILKPNQLNPQISSFLRILIVLILKNLDTMVDILIR